MKRLEHTYFTSQHVIVVLRRLKIIGDEVGRHAAIVLWKRGENPMISDVKGALDLRNDPRFGNGCARVLANVLFWLKIVSNRTAIDFCKVSYKVMRGHMSPDERRRKQNLAQYQMLHLLCLLDLLSDSAASMAVAAWYDQLYHTKIT